MPTQGDMRPGIAGRFALRKVPSMSDLLRLGPMTFDSRLLLGTGKFSDSATMVEAIKAADARIATVALRRYNADNRQDDLIAPLLNLPGLTLMPNTSGARTATEAVRAAHLACDLCGSRLIKLEIHPNPQHLLPDPIETFAAAKQLTHDGFHVMPYMPADPVLAKRLEDVGCVSVMPLGSAIGTGQGLASLEMLRIIVRDARIPVIVDAGLRSPADAAAALELGCDAVLVNSAIAAAENPTRMAAAFALGVRAGRMARMAGIMPRGGDAIATSPLTAFLGASGDCGHD